MTTTINLEEIKNAIAILKQKRTEITIFENAIEGLEFEYDELYESFSNNPDFEAILKIADEIAEIKNVGYSFSVNVDEDEEEGITKPSTFHQQSESPVALCPAESFSSAPEKHTWVWSSEPKPLPENTTPELPNELEEPSVGDAAINPDGGLL